MLNIRAVTIISMMSLLATSCASSAARQEGQTAPATQGTKVVDPDSDKDSDGPKDSDATAATDCRTATSAENLRTLKISDSGESRSLCDRLLAEPEAKKAMVLYVTSPTCVSCKETLKDLNRFIGTKSSVELVVAVPTKIENYLESYSEDDIRTFVKSLAPGASSAADPGGKVWLTLSEDPSNPMFPLVIVFDRGGKGYVLNSDHVKSIPLIQTNLYPKIEKLIK